MRVNDITNDLILCDKSQVAKKFKEFEKVRGLVCKGLSCIDLAELDEIKKLYGLEEKKYLLIYHFHNLDLEERFHIAVALSSGQTYQSFAYIWPSLYYNEEEIKNDFNIKVYRHERIQKEFIKKEGPAFLDKELKFDSNLSLRKDQSLPKIDENFDATIFSLSDYAINNSRAKFFLCHEGRKLNELRIYSQGQFLGLEKIFENIPLEEVQKYISHINTKSWSTYQLLWTHTVEALKGIAPNQYENAKRMLLLEYTTVIENLTILQDSFKVLGEDDAFRTCENISKKLKLHLYSIDQQRPFPSIAKAGFNTPLPEGWKSLCAQLVKDVALVFSKFKAQIMRLPRLLEISHLEEESINALKCGYTGLPLRSHGVSYDIRKNTPFYLYDDLDLNISLGISGSSYDRILIRMQEVEESFSHLIRLMESFPIIEGITQMEAEDIDDEQNEVGQKIYFSFCENSSGEVNLLSIFDQGSRMLNRLHVMGPTQRSLKIFEESYQVADLDKILLDWMTLGFNMEEVSK